MNMRDPAFKRNDMFPRIEKVIQKIYRFFLKIPILEAITKLTTNKNKDIFISPIGSEKNIFSY